MKSSLDLLDLQEVEFDWGFSAKDTDQNFHFTFAFINRFNSTQEVVEWTIDDLDCFTIDKVGFVLWSTEFHVFLDCLNFMLWEWSRLVANSDESRDTLSCTHC